MISQTTSSNNTIHFYDFRRESVEYRMCCLTIVCKNIRLLSDNFGNPCLWCSVALCDIYQYGLNHLHKLAQGLPSYILRTGSGQADSRDVYWLTRRAPMIMSLVTGHNKGGVCRCSAVPTLGWEGGVSFVWKAEPSGIPNIPCLPDGPIPPLLIPSTQTFTLLVVQQKPR